MTSHLRKLLTIFTEAALENTLIRDIERFGATGYTISEARGKGTRGARNASWEANSNIRLEIICDDETAETITAFLQEQYYDNYAMTIFTVDVTVLRPAKFLPTHSRNKGVETT
jgi:nitrogen regulatory protein PII